MCPCPLWQLLRLLPGKKKNELSTCAARARALFVLATASWQRAHPKLSSLLATLTALLTSFCHLGGKQAHETWAQNPRGCALC